MFEPDVYTRRRDQLRRQIDTGLALFPGHDESPMNYEDNAYRFRQDSSFLYYWGLDEPGLGALLDVDEGRALLYGRDPSLDDIVWTGPRSSLGEKARRVGIEETGPPEALADAVRAAVQKGRPVHLLPPYRTTTRQKLAQLLDLPAEKVDGRVSEDLVEAVIAQRSVKSSEEITEIEKALQTTRAMHTLAMRQARPGAAEREVAGAMEGIALAAGGEPSFATIFSVHGETMHIDPSEHRLEEGELVLCDAGGTSPLHYAGDITRVMPVGGRFSERQKEIYQVVLEAQEAAIEAVRPGIRYKDVHLDTARHMTRGMKALGFMKGDVDEAVEAGAHALFFPHGLGHMLGLDAHDMEALGEDRVGYGDELERSQQFGLRFLRLARTLRPGFVLTVEPGIYFIPALIDQWKAEEKHAEFINYERFEAYRDFGGIRIEDDVLVTEEGRQVLGRPIPKAIDEVEAVASP